MNYVVLDHHLDEHAGIYRLTLGCPVYEAKVAVDENGEPVFDEVPDGEPVLRTEEVLVDYTSVHDYVFAADDDRWFTGGQRRPLEAIALEQRELVRQTLDRRIAASEAIAAGGTDVAALPGVGDTL